MSRLRLVWHRKGDLRLHDNELYHVQPQTQDGSSDPFPTRVVSLFVLDPQNYTPRPVAVSSPHQTASRSTTTRNDWLTVTEGPHATRALVDALTDLRRNLQALGGDLVVRRGNPLHIIPELVQQLDADELWWNEIPGSYERDVSETLQTICQETCRQTALRTVASYTMYHPDDLPLDEETWARLAPPKEQRSKHKYKKRGNKESHESTSQPSTGSNNNNNNKDNRCNLETVDCSPRRWTGLPRIMGDFRRAARTYAQVRPCYPRPSQDTIQPFPMTVTSSWDDDSAVANIDPDDLPTLDELTEPYRGVSLFGLPFTVTDKIIQAAPAQSTDTILSERAPGGETAARCAWHNFLTQHSEVADRSLADTSNDQSAHVSASLATGVLSPRHIYWSVQEHQQQQQVEANGNRMETPFVPGHPSCEWLKSHMEMRDHFLFAAFAADKKLFNRKGQHPVHGSKRRQNNANDDDNQHDTTNGDIPWRSPLECRDLFHKWAMGQTGLPLVDAGMNELATTGYCSNRVRQNMASVLTKNLHIDWRIGAEWFQFCLEDHCVGANWGNWRYFGGVGGDPKNRTFRTVSQSLRYDPTGSYVQKWLSNEIALTLLEKKDACRENYEDIWFRPWDFVENWTAIVDPSTQYTWKDWQRLKETGCLIQKQDGL